MPSPVRVAIFTGDVPLPNPSPACLKLLTWLNMVGIPYEAFMPSGPPKSKTGKVPYLELPDGDTLAESEVIMAHLAGPVDPQLTPRERASALAIRRLVEDHLYFVLLTYRWHDDRVWPDTRNKYFSSVPWGVRWFLPEVLRRGVMRDLRGQGLARRPYREVYAEGVRDIEALGACLGDQEYFLGQPTSLDAAVFGSLANVWNTDADWPVRQAVAQDPRLVAWLRRMGDRYWPAACAGLF